MSLTANMNSKKTFKPEDFSPYAQQRKQSSMPKTREEIMEIAKKYRNINGETSDD